MSLERLYHERDQLGYLTDQDSRVCECLQSNDLRHSWRRRLRSGYRLRLDRALRRLVGHPLVFLADDRSARVELVAGRPELQVAADASGEELVLQLVPAISPDDFEVAVMRESPTRFRVVDISDEHRRLASILGPSGQLRAPASSRDEVLQTVEGLASLVTVQSAIGGGSGDAETVAADCRPHLQLLPQGEGLVAVLRVCPLGPQGPAQVPGSGGATVFGRVDDRQVQATRDLEEELRGAGAVMEACPGLDPDGMVEGQWTIPDVEDCLELLLQLRELGDGVVVEWPQGERFRVTQRVDVDGLRVRVQRDRDWFQLSAQLPLDEDMVLDMRRLLELSREAEGRFLPLGEGQFLALTAQFRRRLAEIESLGEAHGDGTRFHRLMTPLVEELLEGAAEVEVDGAWEQQRQRLSEASLLQPEVPSKRRRDSDTCRFWRRSCVCAGPAATRGWRYPIQRCRAPSSRSSRSCCASCWRAATGPWFSASSSITWLSCARRWRRSGCRISTSTAARRPVGAGRGSTPSRRVKGTSSSSVCGLVDRG